MLREIMTWAAYGYIGLAVLAAAWGIYSALSLK